MEGTQEDVDKALKLIREKFPLKKYPEVTLEQVQLTPTVHTVPLIPDYIYVRAWRVVVAFFTWTGNLLVAQTGWGDQQRHHRQLHGGPRPFVFATTRSPIVSHIVNVDQLHEPLLHVGRIAHVAAANST